MERVFICGLCNTTADYDFGDYGYEKNQQHGIYACPDCQVQWDLEMLPPDIQQLLREGA